MPNSPSRELADLRETPAAQDGARQTRHRATVAVLRAYHSLGLAPPTEARAAGRDETFVRLTDLAWSLLIGSARRPPDDPAATAHHLRRQARLLTERRRRPPSVLSELSPPATAEGGAAAQAGTPATRRASDLLMGHGPGGPHRIAVLAVPALRMVLGTGIAGGLAVVLGLEHG
ncbi:hypothetical protein [Streptomyces sp. MZ04]|uniref:hypothetical protein n=1 Tax=Streptomyces sp. MZ04 TaxID=2559236 RepID=UPI00107EB563|nr:hypothetical protein [Streptomyces sp. MZ04]TGB15844.1 hypothetical protein E2651_01535 [Streptomyces sp. MZ04]